MPDNVKIKVTHGYGCYEKKSEMTGRLIGLANEKEARAIINLESGARQASTHSSKTIDEIYDDPWLYESRFILVTTDTSEDGSKGLFISPKIRGRITDTLKKGFLCHGGLQYIFEMIKQEEKKEIGDVKCDL